MSQSLFSVATESPRTHRGVLSTDA